MTLLYANNAIGTLAAPITNVAASITLGAGQAAKFPNPSAPDVFYATLTDAATQSLKEIVQVTAVAGNVFSVVRAQDGTTAQSWNTGDIIEQCTIALELRGFQSAANGAFTNIAVSGTITGIPGRLLNIQTFAANGTYTPTSGANSAIVEGVGGGGAGGGTGGTTVSQTAVGGPGGAGAYGKIYISSGLATQTVTVGAAGVGASGATGGAGGATSFGALMILPGGTGGNPGSAASSFPLATAVGTVGGVAPSGSGTFLISIPSGPTSSSFAMGVGVALPGKGGDSPLGFGGAGTTASGTVFGYGNPVGNGSGGTGFTSSSNAGNQSGYNGAPGIVVVYEYS